MFIDLEIWQDFLGALDVAQTHCSIVATAREHRAVGSEGDGPYTFLVQPGPKQHPVRCEIPERDASV